MKRSIGFLGHIGTEKRETSMTLLRGMGLSALLGIASMSVGCGRDPGQHASTLSYADAA